ncbi:hypothetical protein JL721_3616 [Aureococcus anophagefferens]|nr:hypothetical protein JL721_3616 [Aureococcus anophagefferens]
MRCFYGLVAFLGGVALAAPAADFEYPEAFRQPKPSEKTHLRRALDPDHAANKVYPPDPEEGSPKTFDVWREKFRELYEKQRDGVDNEGVKAGLRAVGMGVEERIRYMVDHDVKPLWPPKIFAAAELR